jgi:hypothetical protein
MALQLPQAHLQQEGKGLLTNLSQVNGPSSLSVLQKSPFAAIVGPA